MDLHTLKENLEARGYAVSCFGSAREAAAYLDAAIDGETVAIGGSITAREMGVAPLLATHNELIWHWEPCEGMTAAEALTAARSATVYLTSCNAIAESGEIVNIDGTGNRVAATLYGPRRVYFLVGSNKVTRDEESAVSRARNVAAPKNAARLGRKTPCVAAGKCMNCRSPERICRALTVLWEAPRGAAYEVILIDEPLGY